MKRKIMVINVVNLVDVKQFFQILWIQLKNYANLTKKNIWSANRKSNVCSKIQTI